MGWLSLILKKDKDSWIKSFAMKYIKNQIYLKTGLNIDLDVQKLNIVEDENGKTNAHVELDLSANTIEFSKLLEKLAK